MRKKLCLTLFVGILLILTGCQNKQSTKALAQINETVSKANATIESIDYYDGEQLVSLSLLPTNTTSTTTVVIMGSENNEQAAKQEQQPKPVSFYEIKLQNLKGVACDVLSINNEIKFIKNYIKDSSSEIRKITKDIKSNKCNFNEDELQEISNLCNNINTNTKNIDSSKIEIKKHVAVIKSLKDNYNAHIDNLTSKYIILVNYLENRAVYLNNMAIYMDRLLQSIDIQCENSQSDEENTKTTATKRKSNIDTYENAYEGNLVSRNNYYNNGYNNMGYGGAGMNGYGGYNNMGYGGYANNGAGLYGGGYGMTNPYGYIYGNNPTGYNPYRPNIDTFGYYRNTDTYKSRKKYMEETSKQKNTEEETKENRY